MTDHGASQDGAVQTGGNVAGQEGGAQQASLHGASQQQQQQQPQQQRQQEQQQQQEQQRQEQQQQPRQQEQQQQQREGELSVGATDEQQQQEVKGGFDDKEQPEGRQEEHETEEITGAQQRQLQEKQLEDGQQSEGLGSPPPASQPSAVDETAPLPKSLDAQEAGCVDLLLPPSQEALSPHTAPQNERTVSTAQLPAVADSSPPTADTSAHDGRGDASPVEELPLSPAYTQSQKQQHTQHALSPQWEEQQQKDQQRPPQQRQQQQLKQQQQCATPSSTLLQTYVPSKILAQKFMPSRPSIAHSKEAFNLHSTRDSDSKPTSKKESSRLNGSRAIPLGSQQKSWESSPWSKGPLSGSTADESTKAARDAYQVCVCMHVCMCVRVLVCMSVCVCV